LAWTVDAGKVAGTHGQEWRQGAVDGTVAGMAAAAH